MGDTSDKGDPGGGEGNGALTPPWRLFLFQMNMVYGNIEGYKGIRINNLT